MARDRRAACRSRRDSRRVADGSANLSRHTFAPSQEERRVAEATARGRLSRLQLARRRLATGVAGLQSRSLADRDHASKQGRHPRRGRLHELLRQRSSKHFLPNRFVLKILKSVAPSPTRAIETFRTTDYRRNHKGVVRSHVERTSKYTNLQTAGQERGLCRAGLRTRALAAR